MKKALKVSLIVVISLLLLASILIWTASYFLNEPLKQALSDEFERQTDQAYTLSLSDIDVGILARSVSVDSIVVEPDSASPHIRRIAAKTLSINGIKWWSLWDKSFPDFSSIVIDEPEVEIFERPLTSSSFSAGSTQDSSDIPDIAKFDLTIKNGTGKIVREDRAIVLSIADINLEAEQVDANALLDGSELIFMENLKMDGGNLKWSMEKKLYEFTIGSFSFDKSGQILNITDLALTPVLPKYEFSEIRARQLDRIELDVPRVQIKGISIDSLASEHLELDTLKVEDAWLEVFRDKHKERPPGIDTKPLLNEVAKAIDFSFGLNTAVITNADIIYEEHKPPSDSSGSVSFNDIDATLTDFRSATHPAFYDDTLKLHVESLFMNVAPLTVDVFYPVFDEQNTHTLRAELGSIDPKEVSEMLEHVGFVRVDDGLVESLETEIVLANETSSGEVLVLYRDLKVSFLDKDDPEDQGLKEKVGDFFANTFVIKSDNAGDNPRVGNIDFEREKEKSIFAYWWKSLLDGLKNSIR